MADWLGDNAWVAWVVLALALAGLEMTTLELVFLMIAAGALGGGVTAALGAPVVLQVLLAAVTALAMLLVVRPIALRHLHTPIETRTGVAALVGRQAVVLERVAGGGGLVRLGGEVWTARPFDPSRAIEPGRTVEVMEIDGATAVVYESEL